MINLKIFLFSALLLIVSQQGFSQTAEVGMASFYSDKLHGKSTASGEPYDKIKMTAAHRTLPFNTKIRVTNLDNNKSVIVTVNDRGPFVKGRIVDVSRAAAVKLGFINKGLTKVKLEVLEDD
ncbi:MAG: septal ring lytic transglycosylase RlpA family protein [Bacteroidota bacterium]